MTAVAWFQIAAGTAMLGLWAMLLATRQVPELTEGRVEIRYHLAAEALTALALVIAGIAVLAAGGTAATRLSALALGALLYTTVNSAGYYAQRREWAVVGLFGALTVAAGAAAVVVLIP